MFYSVCWLHDRVLGKRITVVKSPCWYRRETGRRVAWSGEIEFQKKGIPTHGVARSCDHCKHHFFLFFPMVNQLIH